MLVDGERRWVEYLELADDTSLFEPLGKDFAAITGLERVGPVGSGTARLMRQRALVDFGAMWLSRPQQPVNGSRPGAARVRRVGRAR